MTLIAILFATLVSGIGSVWLAGFLSFGVLARYTHHMLSLAAGALLATAFLHLLPEAFEARTDTHGLFLLLLAGLVFFFLLDKAELWHHGHEHHAGNHAHDHEGGDQRSAGGSWSVLAGDSVHCFGDGVLIASAFMASAQLGILAALAVAAHEVPHHMGDLMVLRSVSMTRRVALMKVSLAGAVTAVGGLAGFLLLERLHGYLPAFLVAASSSFIYVALADLIPQLQKHMGLRQTTAQIGWLLAGIGLVTLVGTLTPAH